ncbi:P-loop containing nucleoside triphosphate hydrolase protein [Xylariomycetidae sp. FL2044]|nr:P-loop containing nucleoside triphosphate hydrolase protein [Xylariomycetidae sp. FL2044]
MTRPESSPSGGERLQSQDHRDLLDIIDKLRSQGISRYVDLPQIIVCGDQSSGKSSVLEAISGMTFPTKDNLCTRFATELILRRSPVAGVKVQILPGPERTAEQKNILNSFQYNQEDIDVGQVVEAAKETMGLNTADKVFSTDVLRVEISGPSQPHLTMVDLPGLFLAGNKDQSKADAKVVDSLVLSYMRKPRSIILAVVSAKSDFALQQVTRHSRTLDPKGARTLGLITKPDTLVEGSESERVYVNLAQNKDVAFRLGWHVLRNRSYAERNTSTSQRDQAEEEFFSSGIWKTLSPLQLGVAALRDRLSSVLRDQILKQLPNVLKDVDSGIQQCEDILTKLGAARGTLAEQKRYLLGLSSSFSQLIKAAVDGTYTHPYFANTDESEAYPKRYRAVIQNTLSNFADEMRVDGRAKFIQEEGRVSSDDRRRISRSDYLEHVKDLMKKSRGRELPGSYNPLIVAELFSKQCQPWKDLARELTGKILKATYTAIVAILQYVTDESTCEAIVRDVVGVAMQKLKKDLTAKMDELLEPHLMGHPITYNHYLTDNVQKAQAARHLRAMESRFRSLLDTENIRAGRMDYCIDMRAFLNELASLTEPNMDNYSCSMAVDMMEAYYKVAEKRFVDDVSVLAVEACLVQKLPHLLKPEIIYNLRDDEVQRLASESDTEAAQRARTTEKLEVLENGMADLTRLKHYASAWEPSYEDEESLAESNYHVDTFAQQIESSEHMASREENLETEANVALWPILQDVPQEVSQEEPEIAKQMVIGGFWE